MTEGEWDGTENEDEGDELEENVVFLGWGDVIVDEVDDDEEEVPWYFFGDGLFFSSDDGVELLILSVFYIFFNSDELEGFKEGFILLLKILLIDKGGSSDQLEFDIIEGL